MKFNDNTLIIIISGITGVCYLGGKLIDKTYETKEVRKLRDENAEIKKQLDNLGKRLNTAVDDLSDNTHVDIEQAIIKEAVQRAVVKAAQVEIQKATDIAVKDIRTEMSDTINKEVKSHYANLKDEIKQDMKKKVEQIDIDDIRMDVVTEAGKSFAKRLDTDADVLIKKYTKQMERVGDICEKAFKVRNAWTY